MQRKSICISLYIYIYIYFFPYFCFINNSIIRKKGIGNLDIPTRNNKISQLRYKSLGINLHILNNGRMTTGSCSPSATWFTMKPLAWGFAPPHLHKQLPSQIKKKKKRRMKEIKKSYQDIAYQRIIWQRT